MALSPVQADLLLDVYEGRSGDKDKLKLAVDSALAHGVPEAMVDAVVEGVAA